MKENSSEGLNKELPDWLIDHLPNYHRADSIPQAFSDSTHQLWRLQNSGDTHKNHFLKVCSNTESPFWQVMHDLFDFDLSTEIANFSETYEFIDSACNLKIPELIKAETLSKKKAYVLTSELNGSVIGSEVNDQMVQQLANHIAELHSHPSINWGTLGNPTFKPADWSNRLKSTLVNSDKKWGGVFDKLNSAMLLQSNNDINGNSRGILPEQFLSEDYLKQALAACTEIESNSFVPMMPDLRWDQFLQDSNRLVALVDLDAFVFAPIELDFVILEYILRPNQLELFSLSYAKHHRMPDIKTARPAYRLLLFYMQILGETDIAEWMSREEFF